MSHINVNMQYFWRAGRNVIQHALKVYYTKDDNEYIKRPDNTILFVAYDIKIMDILVRLKLLFWNRK